MYYILDKMLHFPNSNPGAPSHGTRTVLAFVDSETEERRALHIIETPDEVSIVHHVGLEQESLLLALWIAEVDERVIGVEESMSYWQRRFGFPASNIA